MTFHSYIACVLVLVLGVACTSNDRSVGSETPAEQENPADRAEEPSEPEPAEETPAPEAAPSRVRDEIGADAFAVVEGAEEIEIAQLRMIGALQAEEQRLSSDDRIVGYPLTSPLVTLDPSSEDTRRLVAALLADASYDFERVRRCRNDYLVGVRFRRGEERVEFGLGMGCHQAFFAFRAGGEVRSWGALLNEEPARMVVDAAGGPPP